MTYQCSNEKSQMLGLTKAYGITEKMLLEEGSFESWGFCREAFSHEFEVMLKEMTMGSIIIHDGYTNGLVIEGVMPYQQSDKGNPNYDMACALVEMTKSAVRSVEEMMLLGNYRLHSLNRASIVDADAYIKAVLEKTLKLAADDSAMFLEYQLDGNSFMSAVSQLKADDKTFYQGTTTLDYFARFDAISAVVNYDFWVMHVDKASAQALSLIEDSLLELAVRMGMGRITYDSSGKSIIEDSVTTADVYIKKNGKQEGRLITH